MNSHQIGAAKRREQIPFAELAALEELTSEELAWRGDHHADAERRAWSRWELEHREAQGLYYDVAPDGRFRRSQATEKFLQQLEGERVAPIRRPNAQAIQDRGRQTIADLVRG